MAENNQSVEEAANDAILTGASLLAAFLRSKGDPNRVTEEERSKHVEDARRLLDDVVTVGADAASMAGNTLPDAVAAVASQYNGKSFEQNREIAEQGVNKLVSQTVAGQHLSPAAATAATMTLA